MFAPRDRGFFMLTFLISLLVFGKGDINDNCHVYLGKHPQTQRAAPVVAVEFTKDF